MTAKLGKAVPLGPKDRALIGMFVLDGGKADAMVVCDLPAAAAFGAALALIPAGVAAECVKRGQLDENLLENFKEVLNITGGKLNGAGLPHIKLGPVHAAPPPPKEVTDLVAHAGARADLAVTVAGYPTGTVSIVVARS